jgi:hypothetical protein
MIQELIDLVKSTEAFQEVGGYTTLQQLERQTVRTPACLIIPERKAADENQTLGLIRQKVKEYYSFFIILRDLSAERQDSILLLEELEQTLINAILGVQLPTAFSKFELVGGELVSLNDNFLISQLTFVTETLITETNTR